MRVKYAAYIFPRIFPFPIIDSQFNFDTNTFLKQENLQDAFDTQNNFVWREWLGSMFWDEVTRDQSTILVKWMESKRPDVLDKENEELSSALDSVYHALLLTEGWWSTFDKFFLISGEGEFENATFRIKDIRSVSQLNSWINSGYMEKEECREWQMSNLTKIDLLIKWQQNWQNIASLIGTKRDQRLFEMGLIAFFEALHQRLLDFRIPSLVRAIESVVALPVGKGKELFSERASKFLPSQEQLLFGFDKTKTLSYLKDLYQLRNDCVHGKEFAITLKQQHGENFENILHEYEYILETTARAVLTNALSNSNFLLFSDNRSNLEKAWSDRNVP